MSYRPNIAHSEGFALLLTLIIVSVVLAIGLTILNVTLKQFTLSVTGRESEIAFHVANSMAECFQQRRFEVPNAYMNPGAGRPGINCVSFNPQSVPAADQKRTFSEDGQTVYGFFYKFQSTANNSCGEISAYILDAKTGDINDFAFGGEPEGLESIDCAEGYTCTVVFGRGFNRACNQLDSLRTVQREMTVIF